MILETETTNQYNKNYCGLIASFDTTWKLGVLYSSVWCSGSVE